MKCKGFLDMFAPCKDEIDTLYKSNSVELKKMLEKLITEVSVNTYIFYTKWYTNGYYSRYDFLGTDKHVLNIRSKNKLLRDLITFLHKQGIKVGCMIQLYIWEKEYWGNSAVLSQGAWFNDVIGPDEFVMVDPLHHLTEERIRAIVREHAEQFPELDYIFFECEIWSEDMLKESYERWAKEYGRKAFDSLKPITLKEKESHKKYKRKPLCSTKDFQDYSNYCDHKIMCMAEEELKESGYKGEIGYVYPIRDIRIDPVKVISSKPWWILPWVYFGNKIENWDIKNVKEQIGKLSTLHKKVWYIGDATISCNREAILEMWNFVNDIGLSGYLGCGTPNPDLGLHWVGITKDHVRQIRELYIKMYKE